MTKPRISSVSKVSKKYQATIPLAVREILGIQQGDCIAFEMEQGKVVLKKVPQIDWEYLDAVSEIMSEWSSNSDEEAYGDL
jgi:AbrB family looped-hinge helix DNA binding protein